MPGQCRHQSDVARPSTPSSTRVRVVQGERRRVSVRCHHQADDTLPSTSSSARVRPFQNRLRRGARPVLPPVQLRCHQPLSIRGCEPSKIVFSAVPGRCRHQSDVARPSIPSSARVRAFEDRLRRGARPVSPPVRRCASIDPFQYAGASRPRRAAARVLSVSPPSRRYASLDLFRCAGALPMSPSTARLRPFQCGLRHGETVTSGRSTSSMSSPIIVQQLAIARRSAPNQLGARPIRSTETNLRVASRSRAASRLQWRTTVARLAHHCPPQGGLGSVSSVLPRSATLHRERYDVCGRRDMSFGTDDVRPP